MELKERIDEIAERLLSEPPQDRSRTTEGVVATLDVQLPDEVLLTEFVLRHPGIETLEADDQKEFFTAFMIDELGGDSTATRLRTTGPVGSEELRQNQRAALQEELAGLLNLRSTEDTRTVAEATKLLKTWVEQVNGWRVLEPQRLS